MYRNFWINLAPDIVVIILSNNDPCCHYFENNLDQFVATNKLNDIKTVFVLEPNSIDNELLLEKHNTMRIVAKKNEIPVIEMHNFLSQHYEDGFLWWDFIHLTDFGQRLFAEEVYKVLKVMNDNYN